MSVVLGITGAIGSGKSTFTAMLSRLEPSHAEYESGQLIAELANDFNRALSGELAFETATDDVELVNQALIWFTEAISEQLHHEVTWNQLAITKHQLAANPALYEKLFIYLDTVKKDPQLAETLITTDNKPQFRALLQWLGSYLVTKVHKSIWYDEIFRRIDLHDQDKNLVVVNGLRYPSDGDVVRQHGGRIISIIRPGQTADTSDLTEASRSDITADTTIINDGTLQQLQTLAEQVWFDLSVNALKKTYQPSA